ncbi:MAG: MBL fold metallo-hydrolase [Terriglobia bacterium]
MAIKISVLASSSSGNCTFIATSRVRILLDAGISPTQIRKRLHSIGESLDQLDAVVVSHEHTDHVNGLTSLLNKKNIPVYIARDTLEAISPRVICERVEFIKAGQDFWIQDLSIHAFSIPHDATNPLGFCFEAEGVRIGHVTDLGYLTELVIQRLKGCDAMVLESNHDLEMLKVGPYPWPLKQRIMSRHGHLSNDVVGRFLTGEFDGAARHIVLAHLSENNNHPDIVRMVAAQALEPRGFDLENLHVASKSAPSPMICL